MTSTTSPAEPAEPAAPGTGFLTIAEVSELLRRHRVTVSRMIRDGELRAIRGKGRTGRVLIYADSVEAYIERNTVQPRRGGR